MAERIIKSFESYDTSTMTDFLSMVARNIEDSLIQCGATPGKDYSYTDVFNWSVSVLAAKQKPFE